MAGGYDHVELRKFYKAKTEACKVIKANVVTPENMQRRLSDVLAISFSSSSDPTSAELKDLYSQIFERYLSVCSLTLPGLRCDGTRVEIPVTTSDVYAEATYHIIKMCRNVDGATVEILVQEWDNYIVAFRIYMNLEEKDDAYWCTLRETKLADYIQPRIETNYSCSYGGPIGKVLFKRGAIPIIFEFLVTFQKKPKQMTSDDGKLHMQTLFVIFGEAQRFQIAQDWVLEQVDNTQGQRLPPALCDVFLNWSNLSKCCFLLRQFLAEIPFLEALLDNEEQSSLFMKTYDDAMNKWYLCERHHQDSGMKFKTGDVKTTLESLVGQMLLLNHNSDICMKIIMRVHGYKGRWRNSLK